MSNQYESSIYLSNLIMTPLEQQKFFVAKEVSKEQAKKESNNDVIKSMTHHLMTSSNDSSNYFDQRRSCPRGLIAQSSFRMTHNL